MSKVNQSPLHDATKRLEAANQQCSRATEFLVNAASDSIQRKKELIDCEFELIVAETVLKSLSESE